MRIQIEPTDRIIEVEGVSCRLWNGVTDKGTHVGVFTRAIVAHNGEEAELEEELLSMPAPTLTVTKHSTEPSDN